MSDRKFSFDTRRVAVSKLRQAYGVTQSALAEAAGCSQSKIAMFEGGTQDLSEAAAERVESALVELIADQKVEQAAAEQLLPLASMLHAGPKEPEVETVVKAG